jgi:hypothetical protein
MTQVAPAGRASSHTTGAASSRIVSKVVVGEVGVAGELSSGTMPQVVVDEVGVAGEMSPDTNTEASSFWNLIEQVVGVRAEMPESAMSTASWTASSSVGTQGLVQTSLVADTGTAKSSSR